MTAETLQDRLVELIQALLDARDDADEPAPECADLVHDVTAVCTFDDRGLLTSNDGLVLTFEDGSEFQITIVQSR